MRFILLSAVLAFAGLVEADFLTDRMKFNFYSANPTEEIAYNVSSLPSILDNPNFDNMKPTVFFFYGFTQSPSTPKVIALKNAYLENGGYNFIIVSVNSILYNVLSAKSISANSVEAIQKLVNAGYEKSKIEIVGFSLGAQIGALTARSIPNFTRLTGLDPGKVQNIPFAGNPVGKVLSSSDASFVMTVHTETDSFGDKGSVGHVNGWFNNADRQPMCLKFTLEDPACSHTQALLFWAEAVRTNSATVFPARKCNSYTEFTSKTCNASSPIGYINLKSPSKMRGNYYLNTLEFSPYSKMTADP